MAEDCLCKYQDAWRCAVEQKLTADISCGCGCHRGYRCEEKQVTENLSAQSKDFLARCEADWKQEDHRDLLRDAAQAVLDAAEAWFLSNQPERSGLRNCLVDAIVNWLRLKKGEIK